MALQKWTFVQQKCILKKVWYFIVPYYNSNWIQIKFYAENENKILPLF